MTLYNYKYDFNRNECMKVEGIFVGSVKEGRHTYVAYEDLFGVSRYVITVTSEMLTPEMVGEFFLCEKKNIGQMYSWKDDEMSREAFINHIIEYCDSKISHHNSMSEKYKLIKNEIRGYF